MTVVIVRDAEVADVQQIVGLDARCYGEITEYQTDDPSGMFTERIRNAPGYFWIAEVNGVVEGLLSCQPTVLRPELFDSWEQCTGNGTFAGTLDLNSPVVYVAALTVSPVGSSLGITDRLLIHALGIGIERGKNLAFFSARMPGYHRYADHMSAEAYASARRVRRGADVALDPQIRFYEQLGLKKHRVVENGFVADWKSCGYAVLFTAPIPFYRWPGKKVWAAVFRAVAVRPRLFAFCNRYF